MSRFITTLCLLLGASVASYAGLITSTAGLVGGTSNLQSFDDSSFNAVGLGTTLPLTSFFPSGIAVGASGVNVTITSSGPTGSPGSFNTGSTGTFTKGGAGMSGYYISTGNFTDASLSSSFTRFITLTFSSAISEFLIDYTGSNNVSNYFYLNNATGTTYNLAATNGKIGFSNQSITSVTFGINGPDAIGTFAGDLVFFDNLIVNAGNITTGSSGSTGTNGGGAVPEPATYALIGAGLSLVALARRKK